MSQDFWEGKKVLITGHTGFKGGWLSLWLQSRGAKVSGFALQPPTTPSLFVVAQVGEGMRSHVGDIRDFEHFRRILGEEKPDVIFHLAAQSLVRDSYANPVETYPPCDIPIGWTLCCAVNGTVDRCTLVEWSYFGIEDHCSKMECPSLFFFLGRNMDRGPGRRPDRHDVLENGGKSTEIRAPHCRIRWRANSRVAIAKCSDLQFPKESIQRGIHRGGKPALRSAASCAHSGISSLIESPCVVLGLPDNLYCRVSRWSHAETLRTDVCHVYVWSRRHCRVLFYSDRQPEFVSWLPGGSPLVWR